MVAFISPNTIQAAPGETFWLDVVVKPYGQMITAADVTLTFEPEVLAVLDIEAGDALGPQVLTGGRVLDNEQGRAQIAVAGVEPEVFVEGTVARFQFQVRDGVPAQDVVVRLSLAAADENFQNMPAAVAWGGTVRVVEGVAP